MKLNWSSQRGVSDCQLEAFESEEALSVFPTYHLILSSENPRLIDALWDDHLTVTITYPDSVSRTFQGMVFEARVLSRDIRGRYFFAVTCQPTIAQLALHQDCRPFYQMRVIDCVQSVISEAGLPPADMQSLTRDYPRIPMTVQYQETSSAFLRRILHDAGIYFYFTQDQLRCVDDWQTLPWWHEPIPFNAQSLAMRQMKVWRYACHTVNPHYRVSHVNFAQTPAVMRARCAAPAADSTMRYQDILAYTPWTGASVQAAAQDEAARARADSTQIDAKGNDLLLHPGQRFQLQGHPVSEMNAEYMVRKIKLKTHAAQGTCQVVLDVVPQTLGYCPPKHEAPKLYGAQLAEVIGQSVGKVSCDVLGSVKLAFAWARQVPARISDVPPTRVLHLQAGQKSGTQFIPSVGTTVLIGFRDGNVSLPVVLGGCYTTQQKPPWPLPAMRFQCGIETQGGHAVTWSDQQKPYFKWYVAGKSQINLQMGCHWQIGKQYQQIIQGSLRTHITAGEHQTHAAQGIRLVVGESVIDVSPEQIILQAKAIHLN